jgi:membrane protease YdiL (CAAX protease family)
MDDRVAGWLAAAAISAALIFVSDRNRRAYAVGMVALLMLYLTVLAVATALAPSGWRPWASAIAAGAVWLAVQPLMALGRISRQDIGWVPVADGSAVPAMVVSTVLLAANIVVILARGVAPVHPPVTIVAAVLLAALVEELVMRGVLLALADRASPPRWQVWGAPIGVGGLVVTAAFVALHGLRPALLFGVMPAAILYLWLRARTGSLLPPIVAHVLWNLSVVVLHR